jgi:hypothetical protein
LAVLGAGSGTALAAVPGTAYKLVYEARPGTARTPVRIATVGAYALSARCERRSSGVRLSLFESGPASSEHVGGLDSVDDRPPRGPFVEDRRLRAGAGRELTAVTTSAHRFERSAGTTFLKSKLRLVRLDYTAVADARQGSSRCFIYGLAVEARHSSTPGSPTALYYDSPRTRHRRRRRLARVGPYALSASCRRLSSGSTEFRLLAYGPGATVSAAVLDPRYAVFTNHWRLKAHRVSILNSVTTGRDEAFGTILITYASGLVRIDFHHRVHVGARRCLLYGTATQTVLASRSRAGSVTGLVFAGRPGTRQTPLADSGPHAFSASCTTSSFGNRLGVSERGPQAVDNFAAVHDLDDHVPAKLAVGTAVFHTHAASLLSSAARRGHYARYSSMSFLRSASSLVELYMFGTADSRSGSNGCSMYGTATLGR